MPKNRGVTATLIALLLTLLALSPTEATPAPAIQDGGAQQDDVDREKEHERIPTNDPFQLYPFWLPKIQTVPRDFAGKDALAFFYSDLDTDSRNIVHKVFQDCVLEWDFEIEEPFPDFLVDNTTVAAFSSDLERSDGACVPCNVEVVKGDVDGKECHLFKIEIEQDLPPCPEGDKGKSRWTLQVPGTVPPPAGGVSEEPDNVRIQLSQGGQPVKSAASFFLIFNFNKIFYTNNRYESRDGHSFSRKLFQVNKREDVTASHPEIAVWEGRDEIHVAWDSLEEITVPVPDGGGTITVSRRVLKYRRYDRLARLWIPVVTLEEGEYPHVEVDPKTGIVHIAYIHRPDDPAAIEIRWLKSTTPFPSGKTDFIDSERVDEVIGSSPLDPFFPKVEKPRLDIHTDGEPVVGWVDFGSAEPPPPPGIESFFYVKRTGGWPIPTKVSEERRAPAGDLAVAPDGEIHFTWHDAVLDQIRYRRTRNFPDVKIVSRAQRVSIPRILADTRNQPHILYNIDSTEINGVKQAYAARVNRPHETIADKRPKWGRREPIETNAPNQMIEWVLNQNDNIYATFSRICREIESFEITVETDKPTVVKINDEQVPVFLDRGDVGFLVTAGGADGRVFYSQTFEPNLGEQDEFGMVPWGPNASANALNGNANMTLPIFQSQGVGFSTNLSLIYNSLKWDKQVFNPGWTMNYLLIVTDHNPPPVDKNTPEDVINLVLGDGRRIVFRFDPVNGVHLAEDRYGFFWSIRRFAPGTGPMRDGTQVSYLARNKFGIEYGFDESGRFVRMVDTQADANTFEIQYDEFSPDTETEDDPVLPALLTDSAGRYTGMDYDDLYRLIQVRDEDGRDFFISYHPGQNGLNGRIKQVDFPEGVTWKFEYDSQNDPTAPPDRMSEPDEGKQRRNLLHQIITPRGNTFVYRYRQDNRAVEMQEPKEKHVTNETADADSDDFVATARLSYDWPLAPIEVPNRRTPLAPHSLQVVFEPGEDEETMAQASIAGSNVPEVRFKDRRGFVTVLEYEYARSLVDNLTDPIQKYLVRIFNGASPGSRDPEPTYRNMTLFEDKGVNAGGTKNETLFVYEPDSVPPWVKNNLIEIHRAGVAEPVVYTYTRDGLNRVKTLTDSRKNKTTNSYDGAGNIVAVSHPATTLEDGSIQLATETFVYDSRGRITESVSAEGGKLTFQYNDPDTGLVTDIFRPLAAKPERFEYDVLGNTLQTTLPEGGTTDFALDDLKRIIRQREPTGDTGQSETSFVYDLDSNPVASTNPRGNSSSGEFDKLGRLTVARNSLEDSIRLFYDREGNTRRAEDFKGVRVSVAIYDPLNRTILNERAGERGAPLPSPDCPADAHEEPPTLGNNAIVTRLRYDPNGNAIEVLEGGASAGGGTQITLNRFDPRNNLVKMTHPNSDIVEFMFYDASDSVRGSITRGAGGEFRNAMFRELDERNRPRRTSQLLMDAFLGQDESAVLPETFAPAGGLTTSFRYDGNSNVTATRDPRGNVTTTVYDARNRVVDSLDARGFIVRRVEYNENDLVVKVFGQDARNPFPGPAPAEGNLVLQNRFEYNDKNELKKEFDAFGHFFEMFYDENSNLVLQIDEAGVRTTFEYDALDRLVTQVEDEGSGRLNLTTRFEYDANGNRTKTVDPRGFEYVSAYDEADRVISLKYPLLTGGGQNEESWGYDRLGRMSFHQDANGKLACFGYDLLDRRVLEIHGQPFEVEISREYDSAGNLTRVDDGTIESHYAFDALSRMVRVDWFIGGDPFRSLSYEYDAASNRIRMTGPEGDDTPEETLYSHDADNRLVEITRTEPGGSPTRMMVRHVYTSGGLLARRELGNGVHETRDYDEGMRLVQIHAFRSSDLATLTRFDHTYDERDDRTRVVYSHANTIADFAYDALQRLTSETWTGEVSFFGLYEFDANGNRTRKVNSQVGVRRYVYDEENRLIKEFKTAEGEADLGAGQVAVDSVSSGFSNDPVVDGKKSPQILPGKAWKSEDGPGQHFVQVDFSEPTLLNQITLWVPFVVPGRGSGKGKGKNDDDDEDDEDDPDGDELHSSPTLLIQRFKIQGFVGGDWQDVQIERLQGPADNPDAPGWLKTRHFRNRISFQGVFTDKIRFLQDADGGSEEDPGVAVLSEISLRGFVGDGGCIVYDYDNNGNQIKRTEGRIRESFAYDYANRLVAYTRVRASRGASEHDSDDDDDDDDDDEEEAGHGSSGRVQESFSYLFAPTGERLARRDLKRRRSKFYMYDGDDVVADYRPRRRGGFRVTVEYTNTLIIDAKVARIDPKSGERFFYHADALGSIHALVDDTGQAESRQLTNAWGEELRRTRALRDRYGFTQREVAAESGLMHFRAREYDPRLGRFVQKDPLLRTRVEEHYTYVSNRPTRNVDPLGLQEIDLFHKATPKNAVSIVKNGFRPGGTGFSWFATHASSIGGGSQANATVTIKIRASLPASRLKVPHSIVHKFFEQASSELGKSATHQQIDALRWQKVGDYIRSKGAKVAEIAFKRGSGRRFYAVAKESQKSVIKSFLEFSGKGSRRAWAALVAQRGTVPPGAQNAAMAKYGRALTIAKWGGRLILVVAVAVDVYELHSGGWQAREIVKKLGGWAGAAAGAWTGVKIGAAAGSVVPGKGTVIGGFFGGLIGGITGYVVGSEVAETVYDWTTEPGIPYREK